MTPQEILALSEEVEAIYTDVTTQLIWNICKRLGEGKNLPDWEARKLGELNALTKDSVKIISNSTGKAQRTIKSVLAKAMGIELKDVEEVLKGAVAAGKIPGIGFTVEQSQGLKEMLKALSDQAVAQSNLVNTVMLESTRSRYVWAVNTTADRERKLIEKLYSATNFNELDEQLRKVQSSLNRAAATVQAGAEARTQALARTVKELAQQGITGYIDKGGHHWSPEAYINMDIRTTVHNTAIQAQQTRSSEYGVSTFQMSSHSGARPLCAPYQGKFYSWDGSSGIIHDLYGNAYPFESIYNTSYGEPAGVFGINCGHNPQTFVDGYNVPRYEETKDEEANKKEYLESQKQRYFERQVRQAKLEAIAQDAAGNEEAFKQAAAKVRQANANYSEYCKQTGRTPRPDRLQVYTSQYGKGFDRSMSGKVNYSLNPIVQKVKYGGAFDNTGHALTDKQIASAKNTLRSAPEAARNVWSKVNKDLKTPDYHAPRNEPEAYFSPSDGRTHFRTAGKAFQESSYQRENACFFHEFGHNIDRLLSTNGRSYYSVEYENGLFGKTLQQECEQRVKEYYLKEHNLKDAYEVLKEKQNAPGGMGFNSYVRQALRSVMPFDEYRSIRAELLEADEETLRPYFDKYLKSYAEAEFTSLIHSRSVGDEFCKYVKSNYSVYERTDISDMFERYSVEHWGIQYPFSIGHGTKYARIANNNPIESFAEMYSATVTQTDSLTTIKEFFPESYNVFTKMLEDGAI